MSILVNGLELEHPTFIRKSGGKEVLRSGGHLCNSCHGRGWVWDWREPTVGEKVGCPMCDGVGELEAVVTVEWKAKTLSALNGTSSVEVSGEGKEVLDR